MKPARQLLLIAKCIKKSTDQRVKIKISLNMISIPWCQIKVMCMCIMKLFYLLQ